MDTDRLKEIVEEMRAFTQRLHNYDEYHVYANIERWAKNIKAALEGKKCLYPEADCIYEKEVCTVTHEPETVDRPLCDACGEYLDECMCGEPGRGTSETFDETLARKLKDPEFRRLYDIERAKLAEPETVENNGETT